MFTRLVAGVKSTVNYLGKASVRESLRVTKRLHVAQATLQQTVCEASQESFDVCKVCAQISGESFFQLLQANKLRMYDALVERSRLEDSQNSLGFLPSSDKRASQLMTTRVHHRDAAQRFAEAEADTIRAMRRLDTSLRESLLHVVSSAVRRAADGPSTC